MKTGLGYLVCSYSSPRYHKDLHEMNNQIEKAWQVIKQPSKTRKLKFVQTKDRKVSLNEKLIEKTRKILGIKRYSPIWRQQWQTIKRLWGATKSFT